MSQDADNKFKGWQRIAKEGLSGMRNIVQGKYALQQRIWRIGFDAQLAIIPWEMLM